MTYALDSNIISFLLRPDRNPEVVRRLRETLEQGDAYVIPPLSYYEVYWHLLRKRASGQTRSFNRLYRDSAIKLNMNEAEFIKAAEIRADLEERGLPIGAKDADIFIAAHCIVNGYTLVTDNVSDFRRIDELKFVNWKE
jgi:tRNA(fMet)-specific endonuclease VapC